jgi:hypothetical protein
MTIHEKEKLPQSIQKYGAWELFRTVVGLLL